MVVSMPVAAPKKKAFRKEATLKKQIVLTLRSQRDSLASLGFRFPKKRKQ
jgi:hypothetical protein